MEKVSTKTQNAQTQDVTLWVPTKIFATRLSVNKFDSLSRDMSQNEAAEQTNPATSESVLMESLETKGRMIRGFFKDAHNASS